MESQAYQGILTSSSEMHTCAWVLGLIQNQSILQGHRQQKVYRCLVKVGWLSVDLHDSCGWLAGMNKSQYSTSALQLSCNLLLECNKDTGGYWLLLSCNLLLECNKDTGG